MSTNKLLLIISLLLVMDVSNAQESNKQKFRKLEWLTGKWIRTNSSAGQSGYEAWNKVSDLKLSGKGVTLKGKEVIFTEKLELIVKGNDIFYVVSVTGEPKPVYFKLTAITDNGFTCENPKHDFPKKITYSRSGNHVKAVISGDGKSVDYMFLREE
ncbi:DUF6265 family protein [Dyadobacter psychrotolerans]|uniref:DUF6265 domain-containing protein n=1 Tax=Dyadobacter psychrotolerans TaxID=2541721 RepID=A0A4R5E0X6_9BACT|nr:DUF6265 family protein [Dyadobacter psychrotolerans]TDE17293.1 hypothetical protein E0F88_05215 [Dyadobacter psychrotolerans]